MLAEKMTTTARSDVSITPRDAIAAALIDESLAKLLPIIVEALDPLEVWLFGSRAEGRAHADSDYDLLVVLPDDATEEQLDLPSKFWLADRARVTADIVPLTISEFNDDKDVLDTLARAAWVRGKCLYERPGAHRALPQDG